MKGFDVLHVKSAVKARNKIDLSASHVTTLDFGQIVPLKAIETIIGGEYPIEANFYCRTAPLVKPTYGKFSFKTVNAFVPYHQISFDFDAWMSGKTSFEGVTPLPRYFTIQDFHVFVAVYCCTSSGATAENAQYIYINGNGLTEYRVFTKQGRYFVKLMNCLGYSLPQGVDRRSDSQWTAKVADKHLPAYPLLAFLKLYNDYMSQSQRFNTSALSNALLFIKYNKSLSGYSPSTGRISSELINNMLSAVRLSYDNDYFTSAWQSPNEPLYDSQESINQVNVPGSTDTVNHGVNDTTLHNAYDFPLLNLGQRSLDFLRSFDDWVRRNNFSGSRSVQQLYSRFGIKTDDYRSHYAEVFSTETFPIQVGDVTATADTEGSPLGDYSGKAIMSGSKGFRVKVSDVGMIFVLGYMTVKPMNAFGSERHALRSEPLDYYTPEFDGIGAEAISLGEVFSSPIGTGEALDTDTFGFTERYNSYRFGRDQITGDFRDYRPNGDMNCWHSGRNLEYIRSIGALVAQNPAVNTMPQFDSEYNRIFSVTSGDVDHFYLTCQFKVDAILPILNLNQATRLGEGDTTVPRNGNTIS